MAFDKSTRNRLASFVSKARNLLADEFTQQFQSLYGVSNKGIITPLEQLSHLDDAGLGTALLLRERIDYLVRSHPDDKDGTKGAVDRLAREQAFTVLNRLAAVRMAEKRDLVVESVSKGYQSKGFQVFEQVAGAGLGETYQRYCRYLFCLFDELAVDLGVLFDRRSPQGLLFPRESTLQELLTLLNAPDIDALWVEDETIGWIYQYYNDPAERKKMRESQAPRNSRELAVRNQFFTPRYVVEFLTDNTLGRIWYEMTQGRTRLKDECRYLVRRPTEIFLNPGDAVPDTPPQDGLSQEELLKQPVYITHRPLKDPRDILMLDPACGSMHFGLYAFDLFEVIYDEAWELEEQLGADVLSCPLGMKSLHDTYADKDTFLKDVPRLIIEHNLHGIDIDPRAAQIAGLSLWLRAQRTWQQQRLRSQDRPRIRRSNIVCAEPMPGDVAFLDEFIATHLSTTAEGKLLGQLVRRVFDAMKLAGEAGSLLKIEEEIAGAVTEAKEKWLEWIAGPKMEQGRLFADNTPRPEQLELHLDVTGITDKTFWEKAEDRIYAALQVYAENAEHSDYQRRLFADDAAHGFAFIDLCRKRYDVVLMNPPFGEAPVGSRKYLYTSIPSATQDLFAAFVERFGNTICDNGRLGVISNRLALFKDLLDDWRRELFLDECCQLRVVADLGYGVLDGAVVEAAGYVVARTETGSPLSRCSFLTVLDTEDKEGALLSTVRCVLQAMGCSRHFEHSLTSFKSLPNLSFAYWCSEAWLKRITEWTHAGKAGVIAKKGLETGDDFRYLRLLWEVPDNEIAPFQRWTPFSKGGPYQPTHCDLHLAFDWTKRGQARRTSNDDLYGLPGLTYTERTTSNFAVRVLPRNSLFSPAGPVVQMKGEACPWGLLGLLNSSIVAFYIELFVGGGDTSAPGTAARHFSPSLIEDLPTPAGLDLLLRKIAPHAQALHDVLRQFRVAEPSFCFSGLSLQGASLRDAVETRFQDYEENVLSAIAKFRQIEEIVEDAYCLSDRERQEAMSFLGRSWPDGGSVDDRKANDIEKLFSGLIVSESSFEEESSGGQSRSMTKLSYAIDARYEAGCSALGLSAQTVAAERRKRHVIPPSEFFDAALDVASCAFGSAFGRWDIQYSTGEKPVPELPDPFAPLPVCPPGQLQNEQGLPITRRDVDRLKEEGQWNYPIGIPWDGILVDDQSHPLDIEARIHQVLQIIWKDRWEAIEHEACEILGVKSLRDYFRKHTGFFADHLKRYSKSRRQAPIYWPLSTASGRYTLWIYYHRLTENTLHTALADFIDPKLKSVRMEISTLRESGIHRDRLENLLDLEKELDDFRAEIERIIKLPWKPNLNDGVLITASPLWKLFRLPKWQKDLKACWEKLEKGDYDWAHLAYTIWPKRVEEVCKTDRSIAIAHGLEHLCTIEAPKPKAKRRKKSAQATLEGMEP